MEEALEEADFPVGAGLGAAVEAVSAVEAHPVGGRLQRKDKEIIARAITDAEKMTRGEVCVHVTQKCGEDVMAHAKKVFERLRLHRTKEKNAVLIFVAMESKKFAILGDSGIHTHVGEDYWQTTRDLMLSYFSKNQISEGIEAGVLSVGEKLKKHFPAEMHDKNELSNEVTED